MAIENPYDFLNEFQGWSTNFTLKYRQEHSRHASGRIRVKDIGPPIWTANYSSKNLSPNNLDKWRAKLNVLQHEMVTFKAYNFSRCYPINYPNGKTSNPLIDLPSTGTISSINVDGSIQLNFVIPVNLEVGDFFRSRNNIFTITHKDGINYHITPNLEPNAIVGDVVTIVRPWVEMVIVPDSISQNSGLNGRGSISFSATEARG